MLQGNNFKNIDLLMAMSDLQQITQPVSTGVNISTPQGDFFKNQPNANLANSVGSINDPEYIEAGVPSWLVDMFTGGAGKGTSMLGKLLSKMKFPRGSGFPPPMNLKAHSSIDNLIAKAELSKIPKKPQISSLIPDQLKKIRANTPPNPNKTGFIVRNDPGRKRVLEELKKLKK